MNDMNNGNGKFYGITEIQAGDMQAAMDAEVARVGFWGYPDEPWQTSFQEHWLESHGLHQAAQKAREVWEEIA